MNRFSGFAPILLIALLSSARIGAQSAGHSYPWGDLNVPETGRRYVYVGVARGQNNNTSVIPVERIVEVGTVERAGDTLRYSTTDRITATDGSGKALYDVNETRRYDAAGEVLLLRNHAIPEPFPGDAPASVAFSDGLIAPPVYVDGQTYTYNGLFVDKTLGGSERRRLTVNPPETVTVPAGTFRCVKIVLDVDYPASRTFAPWSATYWYARNIGIVRAVFGQTPGTVRYEVDLQSANFPLVAGTFEEDLRITAEPESVMLSAGEPLRLRVIAEGADLRYAWYFNGNAIPGATQSSYVVPNPSVQAGGVYRVEVTTPSGAFWRSKDTYVKVSGAVSGGLTGKLVNLSVNAYARTNEQELVAGVTFRGNQGPMRVLVRGIGPLLRRFSVPNPAEHPLLVARNDAGVVVGSNENWELGADPAALARAAQAVGAFPLATGSSDAALIAAFDRGTFTAAVADEKGGRTVIECYALDYDLPGEFTNISARGDTRLAPLIVGGVITGVTPAKVLVRAVGPSLTQFGISQVAPAPSIRLSAESGSAIATNQRWSNSAQLPELRTAMQSAGAFPLLENSADAALVATVPAGAFTATVDESTNGGIVLIEVYRLP